MSIIVNIWRLVHKDWRAASSDKSASMVCSTGNSKNTYENGQGNAVSEVGLIACLELCASVPCNVASAMPEGPTIVSRLTISIAGQSSDVRPNSVTTNVGRYCCSVASLRDAWWSCNNYIQMKHTGSPCHAI